MFFALSVTSNLGKYIEYIVFMAKGLVIHVFLEIKGEELVCFLQQFLIGYDGRI